MSVISSEIILSAEQILICIYFEFGFVVWFWLVFYCKDSKSWGQNSEGISGELLWIFFFHCGSGLQFSNTDMDLCRNHLVLFLLTYWCLSCHQSHGLTLHLPNTGPNLHTFTPQFNQNGTLFSRLTEPQWILHFTLFLLMKTATFHTIKAHFYNGFLRKMFMLQVEMLRSGLNQL